MGVELERIKAERGALERVLTSSRSATASAATALAGVEGSSADGSGEQQTPDSARTDEAVPPLPFDCISLRAPLLRSEDEWLQVNSRIKVCVFYSYLESMCI